MNRNMKKKIEYVENFELSYYSGWINELENWDQWYLYWHQASLVQRHIDKQQKLIEVGPGTGFLSNYLNSRGWKCKTIDIDPEKKPDYVAELTSVDFASLGVNSVLAFEVFEHLPFPLFEKVIRHLSEAGVKKILFSVPWGIKQIAELHLQLPKIKTISLHASIQKRKIKTPTHFWELGRRITTKETVLNGKEKGFINIEELKETFYNNGFFFLELKKVGKIQFFVASLDL